MQLRRTDTPAATVTMVLCACALDTAQECGPFVFLSSFWRCVRRLLELCSSTRWRLDVKTQDHWDPTLAMENKVPG